MPEQCQRTLAEFGHVPGATAQARLTELEGNSDQQEWDTDDEVEPRLTQEQVTDGEVEARVKGNSAAPQWAPGTSESAYECARCGNRVSPSFYRVWEVDDCLEACPECAPRSVRFGEDVYGRDIEDLDEFDKDSHNRGKPAGGVQRTA